jgi:dephospho-CoA kinase
MRNQINPDYWVNKTLVRIGELISKGKKKIVIDDIRFLNEAELVDLYNGVIIKINRNNNSTFDNENLKNHESELFIDQIPADFIINNTGTVDDLCKKIDNIILKIQGDND